MSSVLMDQQYQRRPHASQRQISPTRGVYTLDEGGQWKPGVEQ